MWRAAVLLLFCLLVTTPAFPWQGRHYREVLADLLQECAEFYHTQAWILARAGAITDTQNMLGVARACFKPHTRVGRKVEREAKEVVFCEKNPNYGQCR